MVIIFSIIGSIFCGILIFLLFYYYQTPQVQVRKRINLMIKNAEEERARIVQLKLENEQKFQTRQKFLKNSFKERVINPIFKKLDEYFQELAPASLIKTLENFIFKAGKQGIWSINRLVTFWILSVTAGFLISLLILQNTDFYITQQVVIIIFGIILGGAFPFFILSSKIRERKKNLKRQLPEFLDLLCVSVQAGLSFDGAVSKIVNRMHGTIIDEFKRVQNDVKMGMTRQYALTQMAKRCDLEEIYLFITSVIQAEKLGTSMARTLKLQSDNIRERHRQYVKAEALKAPIKILFPMVFFIFPSIFVVLLFPALITLIKTLGK